MNNIELAEFIISLFSIVSCIFIIVSYFLFRKLKNPSGELSLWLAIACIGISIFSLIKKPVDRSQLCTIQGMMGTLFPLSCISITCIIAMFLYFLIFYPDSTAVQITLSHYIFAWVIPFLISIIPALTGKYGREDNDVHCWIETYDGNDANAVLEQFILFYCPLWFGIILNFVVFLIIWKKISAHEERRISDIINTLKWYPTTSILVWFLPTVLLIANTFNVNPDWLEVSQNLTPNMQGFLVSVAYFSTPNVYTEWITWISLCCRGLRHSSSDFSSKEPLMRRENEKEWDLDGNNGNGNGVRGGEKEFSSSILSTEAILAQLSRNNTMTGAFSRTNTQNSNRVIINSHSSDSSMQLSSAIYNYSFDDMDRLSPTQLNT